ncbi:NTP transferase domain-containing protein [bacterium]|jgi:2-C-methyl-D-erythritol 4-phosphate cytidylyltransferase/2-C-methyl-D-erythritol 2,4-cyclodiphosphate synthase|nr:NTP transferase domain-containing protein [bacterium]MBT6832204.1 NTP transferase domain-containing protein [bacterium]MBT6996149.1 NTP transferase domain-containing protein [bacterium]MBT7772229.1 NTP transferase domain-containing protein [bacterium]
MKNVAIILAAGNSQRCGFDKLSTEKFGRPVLHRTLDKFQNCDAIDEIFLVGGDENLKKTFPKISAIISGGKTRFQSLKNALNFFKNSENFRVLVHNGANPNVKISELKLALARPEKNLIFGFFTPNSIKKVVQKNVVKFLDRTEIFETQTPQISDLKTLKNAAEIFSGEPGDEAEILAAAGEKISIFECSHANQKITEISDFSPKFRIGVGEDSHRFCDKKTPDEKLILGGVPLDFPKKFDANSDGDVIFHALANAILSAVGEKTFSEFADEMCAAGEKNSEKFVEKSLKIARENFENLEIENVAISLELENPKLRPVHEKIVENISKTLTILPNQIGLGYTSGEKMREPGVRARVEILLRIG